MKTKCLIISFDLIGEREPEKPLAIASLLSHAKSNQYYETNFSIEHLAINLFNHPLPDLNSILTQLENYNINSYTHLALSCYVWNEYLVNPLIHALRNNEYTGKIIIGGSQITYADKNNLKNLYPQADYFVSGYGEQSLIKILTEESCQNKIYFNEQIDFTNLQSPYLTGEIQLEHHQKMIRWETKRGCPYRCSFCAHRNLENGRVNYLSLEKSSAELYLFKEKRIKKINVLDPIFNLGKDYIEIMRKIDELNFGSTQFSFQSKVELLTRSDGNEFLSLIAKTNSHLEFGLQTIHPEEYKIIDRKNDLKIIKEQLKLVREMGISYEASLIYGLPKQTPDSFRQSIDFLKEAGCNKITAWPLMLLRGTPLFVEKKKWDLHEELIGEYYIPIVTSSSTYTKDDWYKMKELADNLAVKERVL